MANLGVVLCSRMIDKKGGWGRCGGNRGGRGGFWTAIRAHETKVKNKGEQTKGGRSEKIGAEKGRMGRGGWAAVEDCLQKKFWEWGGGSQPGTRRREPIWKEEAKEGGRINWNAIANKKIQKKRSQ